MGEPTTDAPPRKQQQLLQSCQGCVPTASYNVLTHSKIGLPPLGRALKKSPIPCK